jgi:hypothetical protein
MPARPRSSIVGFLALAAIASCSSGGSAGASPASLVSTCDQICANVVAQCAGMPGLEAQCVSACGALNLVQTGCLDPFASYLACIAGATSVQCGANGVLITPPQCESDRQAVLGCNAPPGPVQACVQLPGSTACSGASGAVFCVGAPNGCQSPSPNPIGIGTYCCP